MRVRVIGSDNDMELVTKEDAVLLHFKDSKLVAITVFNGRTEKYKIEEPMNRAEHGEFYETQLNTKI